jgi:hypothetical protein
MGPAPCLYFLAEIGYNGHMNRTVNTQASRPEEA